MSQRFTTKCVCYILAVYASLWGPARAVSVPVRTPPSNPSVIEAQAKYFQDFFSVQLSPYKIEFGHVCEDPNTWEQRYEKKDFKNHRDMGKVRWGDKKGGYGEHYWDLNHAGNAGNQGHDSYDDHDHDDGSYHESNDPYDEPSHSSPSYGSEEYNPESSNYDDSGRAKRAHPKTKIERKHVETYEEDQPKQKRKHKEQLQAAGTHQAETKSDRKRHHYTPENHHHDGEDDINTQNDKKQVVLVVTHKDNEEDDATQNVRKTNENHYVPYESGSGVRQHQSQVAAASVPRLFLEPSTGHVVDRTTGQAYVLQPITKY